MILKGIFKYKIVFIADLSTVTVGTVGGESVPPPEVWQTAPEPPGVPPQSMEPHYPPGPPGTGPPNTHPDLGINMSQPPPGFLFQPPPRKFFLVLHK